MIKNIITVFTLSFASYAFAQHTIEEGLLQLNKNYPQEKIHITIPHSDFIAGEVIWGKAFLFNEYTISNISSTLYVELFDRDKNLITQKKFPIVNGEANFSLELDKGLDENIYFIRAFTPWMTNFNENFFFNKTFIFSLLVEILLSLFLITILFSTKFSKVELFSFN